MCEPEQLLQTSQEGFPPAEGWVGAESSCKPKEKRSASVLSPWQGIYRVNGVKTRVEKLCQAFENGKELVEGGGGGGGQGRGDSRARPGASRASGGGSPAANRAGSCLLVTEWVRAPRVQAGLVEVCAGRALPEQQSYCAPQGGSSCLLPAAAAKSLPTATPRKVLDRPSPLQLGKRHEKGKWP